MAVGSGILAGIELAVFLILHLVGLVPFSYKIPLSILGGAAIAVLNFTLLCLAIQKATTMTDQTAMKSRLQLSYNFRLLMQAGWVVIAFLLPWFQILAAAAPLLYPTVIILYLQSRGKLVEPSERRNPGVDEQDDDDSDDHLESFEV